MKNTEYALALSMGLQSYEEDGSTTCLDVLLDKVFYEKLYEAYASLPKREKPHAQLLRKHRKRQLHIADAFTGKKPKLRS